MKKILLVIFAFAIGMVGNVNAQKYDEYSAADKKIMEASPAAGRLSNFIYHLCSFERLVMPDGNAMQLSELNRDLPDFVEIWEKIKKEDPNFTLLDVRYNNMIKGYEALKKAIVEQGEEQEKINKSPAASAIQKFKYKLEEVKKDNKSNSRYFDENMKEVISSYLKIMAKDRDFDLSRYMDDFKKYKEIYNKKHNIVEDVDITDKSKMQEPGNKDEGITGDVHRKNLNKIVFRKGVIDRSMMNNASIYKVEDFVPGDEIYARFFLEKGMNKYPIFDDKGGEHKNEFEENGRKKYKSYSTITFDGKPAFTPQRLFTTSELKGVNDPNDAEHDMIPMTGQIFIINGGSGAKDIDPELAGVFAKLGDGAHKVKVELWMGTPEMHSKAAVATGEFVYNKKSSGVTFESLEAGMKNPELEAKMVKEIVKYSKASNWKETFSKAKIVDEDWQIRKNELTSAIKGRTISGYLYASWPDGHCSYQVFVFWQDYDGTAYQNGIRYYAVGDQKVCDCSK